MNKVAFEKFKKKLSSEWKTYWVWGGPFKEVTEWHMAFSLIFVFIFGIIFYFIFIA